MISACLCIASTRYNLQSARLVGDGSVSYRVSGIVGDVALFEFTICTIMYGMITRS